MHEGWLALDAGDAVTAERVLREGCEALRSAGDKSYLSTAAAVLAEALVELGRIDEAEEWTRVSEETGSSDDLATQFGWRTQRARVLARRGEYAEAERLAREALAMIEARPAGRPGISWLGDVLLWLADVLRVIGKVPEAREAAEGALETYELKGHIPKIAKARAFLGLDV
jgi:tetratricopeptide (TPR) repeat protein